MATGTLSSNTSTSAITVKQRQGAEPNLLVLWGTWGSGTIAVEVTIDDTNWVACKDESGTALTYTADCAVGLNLPAGPRYRLTMTGGTGQSVAWSLT